jgi:hypothetical protein
MIITSHMQKIIQIYPCLLKLSRKQDTILKMQVRGNMSRIYALGGSIIVIYKARREPTPYWW